MNCQFTQEDIELLREKFRASCKDLESACVVVEIPLPEGFPHFSEMDDLLEQCYRYIAVYGQARFETPVQNKI